MGKAFKSNKSNNEIKDLNFIFLLFFCLFILITSISLVSILKKQNKLINQNIELISNQNSIILLLAKDYPDINFKIKTKKK